MIADIGALLQSGEMSPIPGGGLLYRGDLVVIPGAELETHEPRGGLAHHVSYFPDLESLRSFSREMAQYVTNLDLSSQQCRMPAERLLRIVHEHGGAFVPAHVFTPHKSLYGSCARSLSEVFSEEARALVAAVELGLSADTDLADRIGELHDLTFLSNSDAHSLPKIGREYNVIRMPEASYAGLLAAFRRSDGAGVVANYGLDPRLGKYHRTFCEACLTVTQDPPPTSACSLCGASDVTMGVLDRIVAIADRESPVHPQHRPPYRHQVPLEFVPGLGSVKLNALLNRFGTEMAVLHEADEDSLASVVGGKGAGLIYQAREGTLALQAGGGGRFGRARTTGERGQPTLDL